MSPRTTKSKSHATSWFNRAAAGSSGSWSTLAPGRPASRSLCRWTFSSSARCPCRSESPWRTLSAFARRRTWSCSAPGKSNDNVNDCFKDHRSSCSSSSIVYHPRLYAALTSLLLKVRVKGSIDKRRVRRRTWLRGLKKRKRKKDKKKRSVEKRER